MIDYQMQFETEKPACGTFAPFRNSLMRPMFLDSAIMADYEFLTVDIVAPGGLGQTESRHEKSHVKIQFPHQFYETVVGIDLWKIGTEYSFDNYVIVPFETFESGIMIVDDYGHHF